MRLASFFVFLFALPLFSQKIITTKEGSIPIISDTIKTTWKHKNVLGFDIAENAFVNWNAGGTSSISGLVKGNFNRDLVKDNYSWSNEIVVRYGLNKQDGTELRKTEDALRINSTFGYRKNSLSNWFHSVKFNFNTQFTDGFKYPNKEEPVSRVFAPAYIFLGAGAEYASVNKKLKIYLSPITLKTTLVLDQSLANAGSFGVKKAVLDTNGSILQNGETSKNEFGFLTTSNYKSEIAKNIVLENRVSLYSDYLNKFGNIDVDIDFTLELIVNEYVKTNIGAHLLYDDDIKTTEDIDGTIVEKGAKTQLKQVLGVGVSYVF